MPGRQEHDGDNGMKERKGMEKRLEGAFVLHGGGGGDNTNRRNEMKARWTSAAALAGLLLAAAGCSEFNPSGVRARMTSLVNQNKFQEAREVKVKGYPPGVPKKSTEELMKEQLVASLVNTAEAAFTADRIRTLEQRVQSALDRHDDDGARDAIYDYGITDQRAVNAVTFLAKCAYLNSRVNPATLRKWELFAKRYVDGSIAEGDYAKAAAAAKRIPLAAAYPERIDELMEESGVLATEERADESGVEQLVSAEQKALYGLIAPRAGFTRPLEEDWEALVQRLADLHGLEVPLNGFEKGFEPDWTRVKAQLARLKQALLADDVSEDDADKIAATLLAGFKALVPNDRNGLTTAELNQRLEALKTASLKAVQDAISKAIAEAEAARRKALEKLWGEIVGQLAAAVDFTARENAFTAAVSDRVEPDINRVLGEGARVLRLYRAQGSVTKAQATSLLAAAVYMGFDDVENLAMGFGADIDGFNEKDGKKRTPYLLALQYGFKGQAEEMLAQADLAKRDALGYGAVHYAVLGGDQIRLAALLKRQLDPRRAGGDGRTPLMLAAMLQNGTVARMLLAHSDFDALDKDGCAAIHFAAERGNLDIVRLLAAAGADTRKPNGAGADLVELAASANAEDVLAYLLDEVGLKVQERPVSWCVIHGKVLTLKTLVAHGGKLTDRHLAAAAKCGHLDMVKYLVGQGCDVNSDAVHSVMPSLVTPPTSAEHRLIADYLYSQGYRRKTQAGGRDDARGMDPSSGQAVGAGEAGAVESTGGAAGLSGAAAATRAIADRFRLPGLGK